MTLSATGSAGALPTINAAATIALGAMVLSGVGRLAIASSGSLSLNGLTVNGAATLAVKASASITLGALSIVATGRSGGASAAVRYLTFTASAKSLLFIAPAKRLTLTARSM